MPKQEGGSSSDYPLATRVRGLFEAEKQVRPAQVGFAGNVANFLSDDSRLMLAEAATGVGKTRGYLIPALLHREAAGGKIVVSTHTLTLLRQITQSDETVWVLDAVEKGDGAASDRGGAVRDAEFSGAQPDRSGLCRPDGGWERWRGAGGCRCREGVRGAGQGRRRG